MADEEDDDFLCCSLRKRRGEGEGLFPLSGDGGTEVLRGVRPAAAEAEEEEMLDDGPASDFNNFKSVDRKKVCQTCT